MKDNLNNKKYGAQNINELSKDYNKLLDDYLKQSVGSSRNKTLCNSLKLFQYNIFQSIVDIISTEANKEIRQLSKNKAHHDEKEKEYKVRLQQLDDRMVDFDMDKGRFDDDEKNLDRRNNEMDKELQESNSKSHELNLEVAKLEQERDSKRKEITTLEIENGALRQKSKGCCG